MSDPIFEENMDEKKVAQDLKKIFGNPEEEEFVPSELARDLIELEKVGGRRWEYLPERDQFLTYRDDKGYWSEIDVSYLKKVCRIFLNAHDTGWDKRYYIRELVAAIKDRLTDPENSVRFDPGRNHELDYINLKNGMLDWEDKKLLDYKPDYHSFFQLPVSYDPEADSPRWMKALEEWIPNVRTRLFLQEFVGYCLVPDVSRHKAIILFGSGRNGKSTFLETLAALLGERNLSHIELSRLTHRFEVAHLKDKLVNICADLDPTYIKQTGIIKTIVAGEPIRGEHKFKPSFDFRSVVRLMFSCNELPRAKDKSVAWTRRFEFVEFPNAFEPGDESYDRNLKGKLTKEKSGILNWAIAGFKRLQARDEFTSSEDLREAKYEYRYQNDSVQAFLEEETKKLEGNALPKKYLYRRYQEFCRNSALSRITRQKFTRRLGEEFGFGAARKKVSVCKDHEEFRCDKCPPEEFKKKRKRCFLGVRED